VVSFPVFAFIFDFVSQHPMRLKFLFAVLLPLSFAACLEGTTGPITSPNIPIEATTFEPGLGVNLATSTKTASGLYYRDIVVGPGATVVSGDSVNVYYAGYLKGAQKFDQRISPQTPYGFKTGANRNIPGFDEGVVGMKVGGARQLIIPPELAYGAAVNPGIPPNSVLVFNVEIVSAFKP
jgi:FKBP-type peptidyl-prolyl cis-trans isomerase FkpA